MMDVDSLVAAAKSHPLPAGNKRNFDRWMPAILVLRRRGFTLAQMHSFLLSQGEDVHPDVSVFIAGASRRIRRFFEREVSHKVWQKCDKEGRE